jgi:hypothetical protein
MKIRQQGDVGMMHDVKILTAPVAYLFDILSCIILVLLFTRQYTRWMQHINVLLYLDRWRWMLHYNLVIGSILFFIDTFFHQSMCSRFPCFAANRTDGTCNPCTQHYCPHKWGGPVVALCGATPTKENPVQCGYRYCHLYDDCRVGGGGDGVYLGFSIGEAEGGGGQGLENGQARSDCHEHFKLFSLVFGLGRSIFCLYYLWYTDKICNQKQRMLKSRGGTACSMWTMLSYGFVPALSVLIWSFLYYF